MAKPSVTEGRAAYDGGDTTLHNCGNSSYFTLRKGGFCDM